MVRQRVRIRFCKKEDLRWIGHRDLVRSMERLFRRAGLRLAMSQGFHPKPRMSFPSALAVGIEGLDEVMELELVESYAAQELGHRLASHTLPGLGFHSVEVLPPGSRKARLTRAAYQVPIPAPRRDAVADRAAKLMAKSSCPIQRPNHRGPVDLRPYLDQLIVRDGVLTIRLRGRGGQCVGARDVLRALNLDDLEQDGVCLRRTAVEIES